jgi:hypothetical protein
MSRDQERKSAIVLVVPRREKVHKDKIMFPRHLVKVPKKADLSGGNGYKPMSDPNVGEGVIRAKPMLGSNGTMQ